MNTLRSFSILGAVALSSLSSLTVACSSSEPGSVDPDALVVLQPAEGQALITGTKHQFRWAGKEASATVDISLVPKTGSPVAIAKGLPNNGQADVEIHLLEQAVRSGGKIRIAPSENPEYPSEQYDVVVGSLAAFSWTGTAEEYAWIDVASGAKMPVGTVGDLETWTTNTLAVDHGEGRLYVLGFHGMDQKIYTLDTHSGALLNDVAVIGSDRAYVGLNATSDHRLIAYSWNDAAQQEEMTRIDPTTGATEVLGTVGDLMWWSSETAYDLQSDTAYAIGSTGAVPSSAKNLYALDANTGMLLGQHPLTLGGAPLESVSGLVLDNTGSLLGFRWNGASEDMLRIDPATGQATVIGTVGDLEMWSNSATINLTSNTVHVLGKNASGDAKLYSLDGQTGALLHDSPVAEYPTDAVLVY